MAGDCVYLGDFAAFIGHIFADAGAQNRCADQGCDAADHVDRAGTGVIVETELRKPATAPDPVRFDRVDDEADEARIDAVGGEFCPLRHGAGDDRGSRRAEDQVEDEVACVREAIRRGGDKLPEMKEQVKIGPADQAEKHIFTHHQRIAEK